jgi:hypothetical protein
VVAIKEALTSRLAFYREQSLLLQNLSKDDLLFGPHLTPCA